MVTTMFILDRTLNTSHILTANKNSKSAFWDDCYTQEFDTGAETLEFSCYAHENVKEGNFVTFFYNSQYKMFQITELQEVHKSGRLVAECYCETASLQLLNNHVRPFSGDMNCIQFFEFILQGTEWRIGKYSNSLKDKVITIDESSVESVWSLIEDYKDIFECEINVYVTYENGHVTGQFIDIFSEKGLGSATYKRFEYGKNVTGITKSKDLYDWCTGIIVDCNCDVTNTIINENQGYGFVKGAGDVILDDNHNRMYNAGRTHVIGVYSGDETEPVEACINAWKELEKRSVPKFDYEVTTALRDDEYEEIHLGDTVYVVDHSYTPPLLLEARVGKLELSFTDRSSNKCTLTNYKEIKSKLLDADYIKLTGTITDVVNSFFPITSEGIADGAICEGKIETTYFQQITADIVSASVGAFENLYAQGITVINADIERLNAETAEIGTLKAQIGEIDTLKTQVAEIDTLVNGHLTSDNIQSMVITGDKFTVADGFIKNAMIDNITADKITTGSINTDNVYISSEDGSMIINGSLQQFKDKDGNVRIQIGKDAQDNFTFSLFDENGTGVLINEKGITENAIADGLIVNDMVADNANISGSKLDIDSVVTEINNGTKTIKGTKVILDENNQSLDVAFNSLTTKVENIPPSSRNLLLQSNVPITSNGYQMGYFCVTKLFESGKKYSFAICVTPASGVEHFSPYVSSGYVRLTDLHVSGTEKQIVTGTFTFNNYHSDRIPTSIEDYYSRIDMYRFPNDGTVTEDSIIHWATLVEGEKALEEWVATTEDIDNKIDNLEIGGRNIQRYSSPSTLGDKHVSDVWTSGRGTINVDTLTTEDNPIGEAWYVLTIPSTSTGNAYAEPLYDYQAFTVPLVEGEEYTISLDYCIGSNSSGLEVTYWRYDNDASVSGGFSLVNCAGEIGRAKKTFVSKYTGKVYIAIYNLGVLDASKGDSYIAFKDIMIEKGHVASAWQPAPEDTEDKVISNITAINVQQGEIETLISNTTITKENGETVSLKDDYNITKATVDSYSTKIGSLESTVSDVTSRQSTLEQDLNGFKGTVSSTYTTKSEFNNLQLDGVNLQKYSDPTLIPEGENVADYFSYGRGTISIDTYNSEGRPFYMLTCNGDGNDAWANIKSDYLVYVEEGKTYSISFDYVRGGDCRGIYFVLFAKGTDKWLGQPISEGSSIEENVLQHREVTWVSTYTGNIYLCFYNRGNANGTGSPTNLLFGRIQIQQTDKATPWQPAPEDTERTQKRIDSIENRQSTMELDLNGFRTEVSSTYISKDGYVGVNFIKNGRMDGAERFTQNVPEWSYWGNFEVYDNPRAYGNKYVCLRSKSVSTSAVAGIYQSIYDIPRNTQVTLTCYVSWEGQVNGAWVDITYYKNDAQVGTTYEINKGQSGHFTHTFTTQDIDYDYFHVGFVIGGLKADVAGSFLAVFGNVKLELGNVATAWCENYANYTTKTEFQQSNEDFQFKIQQAGGGNLLRNSKLRKSKDFWYYLCWDESGSYDRTFARRHANQSWNYENDNCLEYFAKVNQAGGVIKGGFDSHQIEAEANTTYSFTCYIASHRSDCVCIEIVGTNEDGSRQDCGSWNLGKVGQSTEWGRGYENWTKVEKTFTTGSSTRRFHLRVYMLNHDGGNELNSYLWMALPCVTKSPVPMEWCPHSDELYDGIVTIDQYGLTVQHDNNKSVLDSEALQFYAGDVRYSRVKGGRFEFTNADGSVIGDLGRSTWVGTGIGLSSVNARAGHSVSLGAQYGTSENYTSSLIVCTQDGRLSTSGGYYFQGLNLSNPKVSGTIHLRGSTEDTIDLNLQGMMLFSNYGNAYRTGNIFGNEEIHLGTQYGSELWDGFIVKENATSNSKNELHAYGDLNMHYYSISNAYLSNVMQASTTYTTRLLNEGSIENMTYGGTTFTEGELRYTHRQTCHTVEEWDYNDEGKYVPLGVYYCYCELPIFMAENIELDYHVNIGKIGWGDYRVIEKNPYLFIVESQEEGFAFTWEVVAKQIEVPKNNTVVANEYVSTGRSQPTPTEDNEFTYELDKEVFIEEEVIEEELQNNINIGEE